MRPQKRCAPRESGAFNCRGGSQTSVRATGFYGFYELLREAGTIRRPLVGRESEATFLSAREATRLGASRADGGGFTLWEEPKYRWRVRLGSMQPLAAGHRSDAPPFLGRPRPRPSSLDARKKAGQPPLPTILY